MRTLEDLNDRVWGWAVIRAQRKYDPFWMIARLSYLLGKAID